MSIQELGDHDPPHIVFIFFIICKLPFILRKDIVVFSHCLFHELAFRVFNLLNWLPPMNIDSSLPGYLIHSLVREKETDSCLFEHH